MLGGLHWRKAFRALFLIIEGQNKSPHFPPAIENLAKNAGWLKYCKKAA
jgi:hypothetical protein